MVLAAELDRDLQHPLAIERHPRRAVGLAQRAAAGQRRRAVEDADVVEPEEAALEEVAAVGVLAVDPPGEVGQQALEDAGQELAIALAADLGLALVDPQRRPRRHRRVDVAEVPLVGRDLAVRVQVARVQEQLDLLLGEVDVDQRQRRAVEGEVPGREPGVLPLVRHRDDVAGDHVEPADVADVRRVRVPRVDVVLAQPAVDVVLVVLLAPQQARERLAHHERAVGGERVGDDRGVERVGLLAAGGEDGVEVDRRRRVAVSRSADLGRGAGVDLQHVVGGALGPGAGVERRAVDDVLADRRLRPVLVVAEQERRGGLEAPLAQRLVAREHRVAVARPATASRSRHATCCGTTASAAGAASRAPGRGCAR